jgi:predicted RNA-binding Zn ribbon-like protein
MMSKVFDTKKFHIVGNNLALDLVNTVVAENNSPKDLLEDFTDLLAWAVAANLLEPTKARSLIRSRRVLRQRSQVFSQSIHLRETLRQMVQALKNGQKVKATIIDILNAILGEKSGYTEIRKSENGFEKIFHIDFSEPHQLLIPIAESAADLLCYANPAFIKKCEAVDCVLYFYDTTKNHSRRWCSMAACGNRAKAAAFYKRKKQLQN